VALRLRPVACCSVGGVAVAMYGESVACRPARSDLPPIGGVDLPCWPIRAESSISTEHRLLNVEGRGVLVNVTGMCVGGTQCSHVGYASVYRHAAADVGLGVWAVRLPRA